MFNHRLDLNNNKFYISSNFDLKRNIDIIFYDDKDLIYQATINIEKGPEYWFSPNKKFKEANKLIVKIYDNEKLIFKL